MITDFEEDYEENNKIYTIKNPFYCPYCNYCLGTNHLGIINIVSEQPAGLLCVEIMKGKIICPECGKSIDI